MIDLASPLLLAFMTKSWGAKVEKAPFKFGPAEGTAFFAPFGWRELAFRPSMDDARRLKREMKGIWFWRMVGKLYPKRRQEQFRRMSAIVVLQNARER